MNPSAQKMTNKTAIYFQHGDPARKGRAYRTPPSLCALAWTEKTVAGSTEHRRVCAPLRGQRRQLPGVQNTAESVRPSVDREDSCRQRTSVQPKTSLLCPERQPMVQAVSTCSFEVKYLPLWRMPSSWIWRCVALERTDVSEERIASFVKVKVISELGTTLAVNSN
jgi:hypothetical protein